MMDRRDDVPAAGVEAEAPEVDVAEQRATADPGAEERRVGDGGSVDDSPGLVNEADWVDQQIEVPQDDEDRGAAGEV